MFAGRAAECPGSWGRLTSARAPARLQQAQRGSCTALRDFRLSPGVVAMYSGFGDGEVEACEQRKRDRLAKRGRKRPGDPAPLERMPRESRIEGATRTLPRSYLSGWRVGCGIAVWLAWSVLWCWQGAARRVAIARRSRSRPGRGRSARLLLRLRLLLLCRRRCPCRRVRTLRGLRSGVVGR